MIDIHSHVLWGMDDGPASRETSLEMLELAAASGTSDLVCSPHADDHFRFDPSVIADRMADLAAVFSVPRLHRGCDFHLSYDNIVAAIDNPSAYTINGGAFLLVEFADQHIPASATSILDRFVTDGITPIVTHPERNPILRRELNRLADWVERGVLLQLTAKSLEGGFGAPAMDAAWKMLNRGLAHFVASDAHDPEFRPPRLDWARDLVAQKVSPEAAELLFQSNPAVVIGAGKREDIRPVRPAAKPSWFSRLRG